ncbi:hypothetical protein ACFL2O_01175 [Thermodesulfobacteriota bacterium]
MNLTPENTVLLLTLVIYIIILHIFERARKKFKGGNLELVIKLIIANNILLLASDYTHLLKFLDEGVVYILQTLLRLSAMCAIAFGGVRLVSPSAGK